MDAMEYFAVAVAVAVAVGIAATWRGDIRRAVCFVAADRCGGTMIKVLDRFSPCLVRSNGWNTWLLKVTI